MKIKYTNVIANKVKQSHEIKLQLNRLLRHSFLIPRNDRMKKILFLFALLFSINSFSQEINYKEYSYTQLFKMIEQEKDSIFKLTNAKIVFDAKTDSLFLDKSSLLTDSKPVRTDSIHINKQLEFTNIYFLGVESVANASLSLIQFHKRVNFINTSNLMLKQCTFHQELRIRNTIDKLIKYNFTYIIQSDILGDLKLTLNSEIEDIMLLMYSNYVRNNDSFITHSGKGNMVIRNNEFNSKNVRISNYSYLNAPEIINYEIMNNHFENSEALFLTINTKNLEYLKVANNYFSPPIFLEIDNISSNSNWLVWEQFENKIIDTEIYDYWLGGGIISDFDLKGFEPDEETFSKRNIDHYLNTVMVQDRDVYNAEQSIRGKFYNYYTQRHEMESSNAVYREIKDLETKRLAFLYKETPSFDTFFTWKINQFLKVFSAYGTKPSKAVTFSLYVILLFAFIYLLFPNSWDSHGKKRLMHRFEFFQKYLRRNEGIHTIYLEGKEQEISSFNDFKNKLDDEKLELPAFFISWSKPLYNASMFSSKLMTRFLKATDVLTGKWKDLTPKQKRWKNIQIGILLILGLLYDVFIKALNALMLSINTFTTLGFGEIPIKGLPRYLAIIQGFIGWFMLTIFSVSLISQLLN